MNSTVLYIDKLITNERQGVIFYLISAVVCVCIGVTIIIFSNALAEQFKLEVFKLIINISGTFMSSLSFIQLKEIQTRRERIRIYEGLKERILTFKKGDKREGIESDKIDELVWKVIEKVTLSGRSESNGNK